MAEPELIYSYDASKRRPAALDEIRDLIHYWNLIVLMIRRDLVTRYKRSVLGVAWTMLNPLGTMLVLSIVFSQMMKVGRGFPAYILTGLVAWNFFALGSSDSMTNLINGVGLRQRVYMPSTVFAITAIGNGLVNVVLSLVPLVLVMLVTNTPIYWTILFFPIPTLILACFTLGVGLLISALAVYFRDITAMYSIILTAWMYLNPIIYPENFLPPDLAFWLSHLNPMFEIIRIFRMPIYDGVIPSFRLLWPPAVVSLLVLIVGWYIFTRKADEFAYRI